MRSVTQSPKRAVLYARVSTPEQAADDKTSIPEQIRATTNYAAANGYEIVGEVVEDVTGRKQDTEGLEKLRDLAEAGKIDAVLVDKWNRMVRTLARFEIFTLEMRLAGVEVISLDGQSNKTASGRMFNRMMAVFSEYQRDDLVETMQRGKRGRARSGRIVPTSNIPYGYIYDRKAATYRVDESRMANVRRIFRMVGEEGRSLRAVKTTFDSESVPTPRGGRYWDHGRVRDIVLSDLYRPHTYEELEDLVKAGNLAPEVLSSLSPEKTYGIQWYNRNKSEMVYGPNGDRYVKQERPRSEWIAVPVEDAGIPAAWVEAARERVRHNVRPSNAGRRVWPLKGYAQCPCGASLKPFTVKPREGKLHFYYVCDKQRRHGKGACPYAKYHAAEELEERVGGFVLELIRNPETLREQVETEAAREKAALRDQRTYIAALASRLNEAESERDRLVRLYARGGLSDDEYDSYTAEIDERKKATEEELARLEEARRNIDYLDELPRLIEDYLKELPQMIDELPRIREYTLDEEREKVYASYPPTKFTPEVVVPGMHRKRTPEELDQLRREAERERDERYRWAYDKLGLKVVAYPDGILEITWRGGVSKLLGRSRWTSTGTWSVRET
jgi:site-specific DNA recombinase